MSETTDNAAGERCNCAHFGHARFCPHHTQEDFDAAELTREGATPDADDASQRIVQSANTGSHAYRNPPAASERVCKETGDRIEMACVIAEGRHTHFAPAASTGASEPGGAQ